MHPDAARDYVEVLLDYQFDLLWRRGCWGVNHAEFLFVQTAKILLQYPTLRDWFIDLTEKHILLRRMVGENEAVRPGGFVPHEFIFYFVHVSRWPEFRELSNKLKGTAADPWPDNPVITWSSSLDQALGDNWADREFYASFQ